MWQVKYFVTKGLFGFLHILIFYDYKTISERIIYNQIFKSSICARKNIVTDWHKILERKRNS